MSFLTPFAFALAILIPVIIAMYLLKLRRTEQMVSSTYLWQRMVRDVEANAPWQRLRRNLLLMLQLLFLLALIFALARPFNWTEGSNSRTTILIFDISASMAATDTGPGQTNRLEVAKEQARLLISNLPEEAQCTIIAAGDNTQVLVSASQDKRLLYQTLETLHPQPGSSDLTAGLELASAIAARQPDAEVVIYSDGRTELPERLATQGYIRFLPIGESDDNQAISLVTLEPGNNEDSLTAFIQVTNYADQSAQRRLILSVDELLVNAHDLEIPAHGQISIINEIIPNNTKILEVEFTDDDLLSLDNKAWTVQRVSENQNITLTSQGNRFLKTVLELLPGVDLSLQSPQSILAEPQTSHLSVFDSFIPTSTLPTGNLFFIAPPATTPYFSVNGSLDMPKPKPIDTTDPILEHVDLENVNILDAAHIVLPDWGLPIIVDESSNAPLLFVGEVEGRRVAVMAFDPLHSDLPLQAAYPILIANLVEWLLPGQIGEIPTQIKPGEALTFTPPPGIESLVVTRPDGSSTKLEVQEGRVVFADTVQLGVYQIAWGDSQSLAFAVNLFNPQESDILPNKTMPLFDGTSLTSDTSSQLARREWWRPIASTALLILFIEWLIYHRATLTKLQNTIVKKVSSN